MRVPAGPPIDPGRQDVRYTGIAMVFNPTARPRSKRENICVDTVRLVAPTNAAKMVR